MFNSVNSPVADLRRAPFDLSHLSQKSNGGQVMKIINLRDYYPFYTQDTLLEVSDEVAQAMAEAERLERNYISRMYYHKAQYSLCLLYTSPSPRD